MIYDWKTSKCLSDWKVEGMGEISITEAGELRVHTDNGMTHDGKMAFRNFSGVSEDYYASITVREIIV